MNIENLRERMDNAAKKFNEEWTASGREDRGCCGMAVLLLSFGRKRKIKEQFMEEGIINENSTWDYCGIKCYVVRCGVERLPMQVINYPEGRERAIRDEIEEDMKELGIEVFVNSWID